MRLFIAEKPSMAAEIAKCLPGPLRRKEGCIMTGDGVVTWAFGHILRQAEPDEYDGKYKIWRAEDLPIIPDQWRLFVVESSRKQFEIVADLINRATEIVHAGDPDREGQLLIDEVLDYVDNHKPVQRLLLNALDEKSITRALAALRSNSEFHNLKQSALARARADWLIGMNLSRAYTLAARRAGHRVTLPIGRVKTPTLALIVRRERELAAFRPVEYFTVKGEYRHHNGLFTAYWKPRDNQPGLDSEGRLSDAAIAKKLLEKLKAAPTARVALCETSEKREAQRLPLSLSALQVLAGKKYGYDPQTVLDTAQELYERKLTTYPRSDCDYLPESQHGDSAAILANLGQCGQSALAGWAAEANPSIVSRAWNDAKITAHHAIIPTTVACKFTALSDRQRHVYYLIAQLYLAQFYPVHVYDQTRVELDHAGELLTANGRVVTEMGWKKLFVTDNDDKDGKKDDDDGSLPAMAQGDTAALLKAKAEKKATKPPLRFTAATLIAAMKEIHKYVKNPDLKQQLKDVAGIGTEATRATIIKELSSRGFLREEGKKKYLVPTDQAYLLIDALPDELTYPDSTAKWEYALQQMAEGAVKLESFLEEQTDATAQLCTAAHQRRIPLKAGYVCPRCRQGILQQRTGRNGVFWGCSRYPACRGSSDDDQGKPKEYFSGGD
mgnify:CR=1 FL=1